MTSYIDSLNFLRRHLDARSFIARASVHTVRPEEYRDADTASAVLAGERVWLFRTASARDAFVRTVSGAAALEELPE